MTKVWKSKIWDDSFLAFSVGFVVVYSVFSVGAVITEIFADQNRQFCKFPNKTKNGRFRTAKFGPKKWFFLLFLPPILFACPRGTFWTPKLWSGTQNEDFQRWSPSDQKWSFLIILTSKVPVKSPVRFNKVNDFEFSKPRNWSERGCTKSYNGTCSVFLGKFADQNHRVLKFLKKLKKTRFCSNDCFGSFPQPSSWPDLQINFFTDPDMIEAITQIWAKT